MYNPADVRWHVLIDIMSQYYPCYYRIFGLNGVKTFNPTSTLDLFLLCNSKGMSTGVVVKCKESKPFQAKLNNTSVYWVNSMVHPGYMAVKG